MCQDEAYEEQKLGRGWSGWFCRPSGPEEAGEQMGDGGRDAGLGVSLLCRRWRWRECFPRKGG